MSNSKNTPTPWEFKTTNGSDHQYCTIYATAGKGVARHASPEDAALIVRAVNMHEELVQELYRALGRIKFLEEKTEEAVLPYDDSSAKSLLKKATE